jgi:hypothetical protein
MGKNGAHSQTSKNRKPYRKEDIFMLDNEGNDTVKESQCVVLNE